MKERPEDLYLHHATPLRRRVSQAVDELVDEERTVVELVRLLIGLARMRLGPLRPIPEWQRIAAAACDAAALPGAGEGLRLSAELETHHHLFLLDDLVQLHTLALSMSMPYPSLRELVRGEPEPRAREHARVREQALSKGGVASLAVELELAELGRTLGPALLDAWDQRFFGDGPECMLWVRARATDADRRAKERSGQVCEALVVLGEGRMDRLARDWVRTAEAVVDSYLEALVVGMRPIGTEPDDAIDQRAGL